MFPLVASLLYGVTERYCNTYGLYDQCYTAYSVIRITTLQWLEQHCEPEPVISVIRVHSTGTVSGRICQMQWKKSLKQVKKISQTSNNHESPADWSNICCCLNTPGSDMQPTMKKIFSFFSIFCFLKLVSAEEGDDRLTTKGISRPNASATLYHECMTMPNGIKPR